MDTAQRNTFNSQIVEEFRANKGVVVTEDWKALNPLLILHNKGAKSGAVRLNPLMYQDVDGSFAVFAAKGGEPMNPDWFHNLRANPQATVEVGEKTLDVVARIAEGDERERIWEAQKRLHPMFVEMEEATTRLIPVVVLDPVA